MGTFVTIRSKVEARQDESTAVGFIDKHKDPDHGSSTGSKSTILAFKTLNGNMLQWRETHRKWAPCMPTANISKHELEAGACLLEEKSITPSTVLKAPASRPSTLLRCLCQTESNN